MNKHNKLKTFCPLPWSHISSYPDGVGRLCCEGLELLRNGEKKLLWKDQAGLHSYFNSPDYKKTRREMLNGKRPKHCNHCFKLEDHGVQSLRLRHISQSNEETIDKMIQNTNQDGSVDNPEITYIEISLNNKCNLKCRMCNPGSSFLIAKDWLKMGKITKEHYLYQKKVLKDKWYSSANTLRMIKQALPYTKEIFFVGGEPMIIEEHLDLLKIIVKTGHAGHIKLRYNSNQTVIPEKVTTLWKHFKTIEFNCSVEAVGELNNYIRYPSKWETLEKNMYFLDQLAYQDNYHINIFIHSTLQAYNVMRIPEMLSYFRRSKFKILYRFPLFTWVKQPGWCSPGLFPKSTREETADKILESLNEHENFFLNYNKHHQWWSQTHIHLLKQLCEMIRNDNSSEQFLNQFVKETKTHDKLRKQSILDVLPELTPFFL